MNQETQTPQVEVEETKQVEWVEVEFVDDPDYVDYHTSPTFRG